MPQSLSRARINGLAGDDVEQANETLPVMAHTARQFGGICAVRKKLAFVLFLYILGSAVLMQIYPKIALDYYGGNNAKASTYSGTLAGAQAGVQLFALPTLSAASDILGRRTILMAALLLHALAALVLALDTTSLALMTACQLATALCMVILPVASAIIGDVCRKEGPGAMAHGFGVILATFGVGLSIGPLVGGYLSSEHRRAACILVSCTSTSALLFVSFFGWAETRPALDSSSAAATSSASFQKAGGRRFGVMNPLAIMKIFLEDRMLLRLATCYFLMELASGAYVVLYNLLNYRYGWGPELTGAYFSYFGVTVAVTQGVLIRWLVPKPLSENRAVLVGTFLHVANAVGNAMAVRGWMLFPITAAFCVQTIAEPCIQAVMSKTVSADRQGSLQGALSSLRTVTTGLGAPAYAYLFSLGISSDMEGALGYTLPALPYFVSTVIGLMAIIVAYSALRMRHRHDREGNPTDHQAPGTTFSSPSSSRCSPRKRLRPSSKGCGEGLEEGDPLREPLLVAPTSTAPLS